MFKTETHLHTYPVSPCSRKTPEEMVEAYVAQGFSTIFVTDHFTEHALSKLLGDSFEEHVSKFLELGYEATKKAAEGKDLIVLPAAEFAFHDNPNHFVIYNFDLDFLKEDPHVFDLTPAAFYRRCHERGIFVVQVHPFRINGGGSSMCYPEAYACDAMECYNGAPRHFSETQELDTIYIAEAENKPMTSGSDAHLTEDLCLGGVATDFRIETPKQYVDAIVSGDLYLLHKGQPDSLKQKEKEVQ